MRILAILAVLIAATLAVPVATGTESPISPVCWEGELFLPPPKGEDYDRSTVGRDSGSDSHTDRSHDGGDVDIPPLRPIILSGRFAHHLTNRLKVWYNSK